MQNPKNLHVYPLARTLALTIYRATASFSAEERFALTSQMRRAAVSVGSNIAEGCGRYGNTELGRFCSYAMGSASELEFQSMIAEDLGFSTEDNARAVNHEIERTKRGLSKLILYLRNHPN